MWFQLSTLSLCLLAVVTVSSALPSSTSALALTEETPISDRRTFKHKKHLPLLKKHKKFGGWLPHVFGKTEYRGVPTPIYKVHRYHGLEVKPVTNVEEVSFLTSGPVLESHAFVPPPAQFEPFDHLQQPAPPVFDHVPYQVPFLPTPLPPTHSFAFFQPAPVAVPKPIVPDVHVFPQQTLTVSNTPAAPVPIPTPAPLEIPAPVSPGAPLLPPLALPPAFSSLHLALPSPPALPPLPALPFPSTPAPLLAEPEYPPSGFPVHSFLKESDHHEIPHDIVEEDVKALPQPGLLQKIKGWKVEKVTSALSHLHKAKPFKHTTAVLPTPESPPQVPVVHLQPPTVVPVVQTVQFPEPIHPPSFYPPQVFFPTVTPTPTPFVPLKYESFPPYPTPAPQQLFNSYGAPIPHDSYAPPNFSHDRVSSAATEEKSSVLPAPPSFTERIVPRESVPQDQQQIDQQQQPSQIVQDFLAGSNHQQVPLQAAHSDVHPVYTEKDELTGQKGIDTNEQSPEETTNSNNQQVVYSTEQVENSDANTQAHPNHKEE